MEIEFGVPIPAYCVLLTLDGEEASERGECNITFLNDGEHLIVKADRKLLMQATKTATVIPTFRTLQGDEYICKTDSQNMIAFANFFSLLPG